MHSVWVCENPQRVLPGRNGSISAKVWGQFTTGPGEQLISSRRLGLLMRANVKAVLRRTCSPGSL